MTNIELAEIIPMLCTYQLNKQPPLTIEQFQAFETALECSLPDDVKQLYLEHDGHDAQDYHPMFLMPSKDALEVYADIKRREGWWRIYPNLTDNIRYLWHDEDGNFGGVYVAGSLVGKFVFNDHEDQVPTPVFRSITTFYCASLNSLKAGFWGWEDMKADYPVFGEIMPEDAADDLAVTVSCLEHWKEAYEFDEYKGWALCIIALIPPAETGRLLPYLNATGFSFYRGNIMKLFAKRRYELAIKELVDWLPNQVRYLEQGAFLTIGEIGGNEAGPAILNLTHQISQSTRHFASLALQKCGYQIREIDGGYEYLAPNESTWQKL